MPSIIAFQPFFPELMQLFFIYMRLLIAPIIILIYLHKHINIWLIILFAFYIISISLINPPTDFRYFALIFLSIFASISYFKLGAYLNNFYKNQNDIYFISYIAYGVTFFNICSLIIYYFLGNGYLDPYTFFETANKENIEMFRFSVGNPLEVPFVMTSLIILCIILLGNKQSFIYSTFINAILTVISQSRLLVIIAVLLFLYEFIRVDKRKKLIMALLLYLIYPYIYLQYGDIVYSYFDRLSYLNDGSGTLRIYFLNIIMNNVSFMGAVFGEGLTSSVDLSSKYLGHNSTVESVLLQFFYEIGVIGIVLFFSSLYINKGKYYLPTGAMFFIIILMYVQTYFMLPIFTLLPFVYLMFGAATKSLTINDIHEKIL